MGQVTIDLNTWWADVCDHNESNQAKAELQDIMIMIDEELDRLQAMNANSDFDKLPASWKAKAIWAWGILDAARDTVKADAEFMEGINWRP